MYTVTLCYTLSSLRILSLATICAAGTGIKHKAYIVAGMKYFVVGDNTCGSALNILSPHCKLFLEDIWVDEREREGIIIIIKFKILMFHVCVHPNDSLFVWSFSSHSRIFNSYGEVTFTGEGLQILTRDTHRVFVVELSLPVLTT